MKKKLLYLMSCWIIFIGLFMLAHSILSKIIMYYQRMPAIETAQAYQLISRYKQSVINFYQETGRCPTMKDKKQIIPKIEAYTYVKVVRFLADQQNKICFISVEMRDDTPSRDVKNQTLAIAYKTDQPQANNWICYTSINSIYTIKECRGNSLPDSFLKALAMYKRNMR